MLHANASERAITRDYQYLLRARFTRVTPGAAHASHKSSRDDIYTTLATFTDTHRHFRPAPQSASKRTARAETRAATSFRPHTYFNYNKPLAVISIIHNYYPLNHKLHLTIVPPPQIVLFVFSLKKQSVMYVGTVLIVKYCGLAFHNLFKNIYIKNVV